MGTTSLPAGTGTPVPVRPRLSRRRKLAFTALLLVAAFLVCEGALRLRAWIKYGGAGTRSVDEIKFADPDLGGQLVLRPGYEVRGRDRSLRINSLGYRGAEFARTRPVGTIRIVCIGGSTTFCGEVDDDATWPHQLGELLRPQFPGLIVEVINAGVPGYNAADCRRVLGRVLDLQPDLVIFYEANNQMAYDTRRLARKQGLVAEDGGNVSEPIRFLARWSLTVDLVHKNTRILLSQADATQGKLEELPDDLTRTYVEELGQIHTMVKNRGVSLVLATFIVKYRRDQSPEQQVKNADIAFYYMPWMRMEHLVRGIDLYNDALLTFGRDYAIPVVDDRECVPPDAEHFVDCMHFTRAGCSIMARRMATFLQKEGLLQRVVEARK